jgi:hypothetical protein
MFCSVKQTPPPRGVRAWVLVCALLNASGWILSSLHALTRTGYLVALLLSAGVAVACLRGEARRPWNAARLLRRFRRPFPLPYVVLALLALTGGLLYPPSNFDALAFRVPRVLHWLAAGQWHWMSDFRGGLNTRTCGFEWVSAPALLFLNTDRWLFLINSVAFLLLPGLVFSFLNRLGLSGRAAWHWMWVLPAGMCFVLQAGSLGNDLFGVVMTLAAMDFALRARGENGTANLRYSLLAAALMTSAKISNLTLLLPWVLLLFPALRAPRSARSAPSPRPARSPHALTIAAVALAGLASFLPTAALNWRHCGDWTGMAAENAWLAPPSKAACFTHNAALLTVQHLAPPVFPFASAWDRAVQRLAPEHWKETLDSFAEEGRYSYRVRELPSEEHAGLGLGLALLLLAQIAGATRRNSLAQFRQRLFGPGGRVWGAFLLSGFAALGVFMCKSGMLAISRIISPYYALLLPLVLLASDSSAAVRVRWWKVLAGLAFLFALMAVVLNPARPIFPAQTLLGLCRDRFPSSRIVERAEVVYAVYRDRHDVLRPLRLAAPESVKVLGLVTMTTPETSLWRPFGSRRVVRLDRNTSQADARRLGIEYVVVEGEGAEQVLGRPLAEWLQAMNAAVVTNIPVRLLASQPPLDYKLVRLGP